MRFAVTEALNRRDTRIEYLLFDGKKHAMCGRAMRPLPARAGISLQGGPVFSHRELAPFFREDLF